MKWTKRDIEKEYRGRPLRRQLLVPRNFKYRTCRKIQGWVPRQDKEGRQKSQGTPEKNGASNCITDSQP